MFLIKQKITSSLQRFSNTTRKPQTRVYFVKNNARNCPQKQLSNAKKKKSVFEFLQPYFKTRSAMSLIGTLCFPFTFNISLPQLILIITKRNTEEFLPRITGCNPVQLINHQHNQQVPLRENDTEGHCAWNCRIYVTCHII
jgi:hypothetical protein